jgi:hypothetical protein
MEDKILLIFISTFRDYCFNAEHYYGKVGFVDKTKFDEYQKKYENYAWEYSVKDEVELTYHPTEKEAFELAKKDSNLYDYEMLGVSFTKEQHIQNMVEQYMEDGTRRFPSVYKVIETAINEYPEYKWVGLFENDIEDFEKHWKRIEKENPLIDKNKYEL